MVPKLPRLTADKLARALLRTGFVVVRQSGSHRIYEHPDGRRCTVAFHSGQILPPKTLRGILDDAAVDMEDL
jgi:predicted RNA binding protein YcfA (HicA-like mRNA interferase family)